MRSRNHTKFLAGALVACLLAAPFAVRAADVGVRAGYAFDSEAVILGMELLTSVGSGHSWFFNPNLEFLVADGPNQTGLNFDFHYDFASTDDSNLTVWAGGGPALYLMDRGPGSDDMDIDPALNLLVGGGAMRGNIRPYVQGKGVLKDNSEISLSVGLRF